MNDLTFYPDKLILLTLIYMLAGCTHSPEGSHDQHEVAHESILASVWAAHGGLKAWQNYRTLSFDMTAVNTEGEQSVQSITTDLQDRRERIEGDGYVVGYDGQEYWKEINDTSRADMDVKFQINLQFYFFAVPFVLADPGVNLEKLEDRELNGKTYQVVRVTFDDGTGVAPEDQYVLYVDPETNRMEVLLYSVTYFDSSRASNYSANHYADWQEVGGLLVPQKLVRYHWNPDGMTFGSTRGEKLFDHVEFSQSEASLDVYSQ